MLVPLGRFLVAPFALAGAVMLMGLPDLPALDRAVSKALASVSVAPGTPALQPVLVTPPLAVDKRPVALTLQSQLHASLAVEQHGVETRSFGRRRGDSALVPLYASFVALQGLDVHSTLRALDRGGREANSFMAPVTERPAAFVALKAGTTAGILYLTERVRHRSPTAAIVMMAAFNSAYAMVVTNNYRIGNQLR